jgi:hypothetical protein
MCFPQILSSIFNLGKDVEIGASIVQLEKRMCDVVNDHKDEEEKARCSAE